MPSLSPEQLQSALARMATDTAEDSFGVAVSQVVVHGDQRFAPVAVAQAALGAEGASHDEPAAVALLQAAGAEIENKATSFPGFKRFFLPTLRVFADNQPRKKKDAEPLVAKALRLSPSLCASSTKKEGKSRLKSKVGWSCDYLNAAGLLQHVSRGTFAITPAGQELLAKGLAEVDQPYLKEHYPSFAAYQKGADDDDDTTPTIWVLGSGNNGSMRPDFLAKNYVGIDFGIRVNLATATEAEVDDAFQRHGDETKGDNRRACVDFSEEMEPGDYVLLKDGRSTIAAYGRIEGDYEFKASAVSYSHQRKVVWLSTQELKIPREQGMLALKTLTEAKLSNPAIKYALAHYQAEGAAKPVWLARVSSPTAAFADSQLAFDWEGPDPAENLAAQKAKKRPRFNFSEMQIPIGSKLQYVDGDIQIEVTSERKVSYENRERTLSEVTRTLKKLDRNVQPVRFWTFNGVNLLDTYNQTYPRQAGDEAGPADWRQDFLFEMQVGDLVLAATGEPNAYRVGEITSAIQHDPALPSGKRWRTIRWRDQTINSEELAEIEGEPVELLDDEALPEAVSALLFPAKDSATQDKLMKAKPTNLILFGPPGTGKTYVTAQHAVSICQGRPLAQLAAEDYRDQLMADYRKLSEAGNIAFVTFHQTYDYTDFVEGLRPQVTADKRMTYELVPGALRRLASLATDKQRQGEQFVLIIDEINRGNVSKILGELITLIESDKRLTAKNELKVTLPISGDTFGLPLNLHLIGTMNTADRSIALIDTALRRRFDFIAMDPQPEVLDSSAYAGDVKPGEFLKALNRKLAEVFRDREHAIGHAWFMPDGEKPRTQAQVLKAFKDKVVPTLTEWLWDSPEKLREILGDEIVDEFGKVDPAKLTDKCLADMVGNASKPNPAS